MTQKTLHIEVTPDELKLLIEALDDQAFCLGIEPGDVAEWDDIVAKLSAFQPDEAKDAAE